MKILRFLASGPIQYVNRKIWKKSSSVNYRETGGYFIDGTSRTLDLHVLFRPFIELFNTNSKSVYKCSGRVCLDEVLSKSRSRKNQIRQYNSSKRDKVGFLYHMLVDCQSNFLIKTELKMSKQFMKPQHYKIIDLCIDFLREFEKTYVFVCMDNYFTSYDLAQEFNDKEILIFGTTKKSSIARYFQDHPNRLAGYMESKNSKNNNVKCFTASIYDHPTRGRVHIQIYNSKSRNPVLFITNSNSAVGKSDEIFVDHRTFLGGHFSRSFPDTNKRPISAKFYNDHMNGVDNYDVYLHKFNLRYIPLRNNLSWISKPILSIIDYQMLNCYFLHKEMHENPLEYRKYLLRLAQGFCRESLKPRLEPLRVNNQIFARSKCRSCSNITPYKDTRTTQVCRRCGSGCCKTHSRILCSQCFDS